MGSRVVVATFDAVGGPAALSKADDGYYAGPTDAGVYRVALCGKHSSPSYPDWSKIRWGSEIKEEGGAIFVKHDGRWQDLKILSPRLSKQTIMDRNLELYGTYTLPKTWVFNDFGHMTCYFYKDRNNNGRLDRQLDEHIHAEYFHTTPDDEAVSAAGGTVNLGPSHGCIHLKPKDIDAMIGNGYFKPGNKVVVHSYTTAMPAWVNDSTGVGPFEVHFFPGSKKVIVSGRRRSL